MTTAASSTDSASMNFRTGCTYQLQALLRDCVGVVRVVEQSEERKEQWLSTRFCRTVDPHLDRRRGWLGVRCG